MSLQIKKTCHPQTTDKKVLQLLVWDLVCAFSGKLEKVSTKV